MVKGLEKDKDISEDESKAARQISRRLPTGISRMFRR
jgi:hypothetical protein